MIQKKRNFWNLAWQGVTEGGPSMCQFAITSNCNARCGFCNFAVDKMLPELKHSVSLEDAKRAAENLYNNGVYFLIYVGGEPMLHPQLEEMIRHASGIGMAPMLVTNGSLLSSERIKALAEAGLVSVIISIDAASAEKHENNRGLKGVCERIKLANELFKQYNIGTTASVTMSRLIDDYTQLPKFLTSLGFDSVTFSYPLTTLASNYLGYADSNLVDYTVESYKSDLKLLKLSKNNFMLSTPQLQLRICRIICEVNQSNLAVWGGGSSFI